MTEVLEAHRKEKLVLLSSRVLEMFSWRGAVNGLLKFCQVRWRRAIVGYVGFYILFGNSF